MLTETAHPQPTNSRTAIHFESISPLLNHGVVTPTGLLTTGTTIPGGNTLDTDAVNGVFTPTGCDTTGTAVPGGSILDTDAENGVFTPTGCDTTGSTVPVGNTLAAVYGTDTPVGADNTGPMTPPFNNVVAYTCLLAAISVGEVTLNMVYPGLRPAMLTVTKIEPAGIVTDAGDTLTMVGSSVLKFS